MVGLTLYIWYVLLYLTHTEEKEKDTAATENKVFMVHSLSRQHQR
jgi:hypothetical protein